MRTYYSLRYGHQAIAVVAIMLVSFGVKMFFLSPPTAEADINAVASANMDILHPVPSEVRQQGICDWPRRSAQWVCESQVHDMTFVFSLANE